MSHAGLAFEETAILCAVFRKYPQIERVILFGSRAKGTAKPNSDIDLALVGDVDDFFAEQIALELDDTPLPYKYDVKSLNHIDNQELLDHINRIGVTIYFK